MNVTFSTIQQAEKLFSVIMALLKRFQVLISTWNLQNADSLMFVIAQRWSWNEQLQDPNWLGSGHIECRTNRGRWEAQAQGRGIIFTGSNSMKVILTSKRAKIRRFPQQLLIYTLLMCKRAKEVRTWNNELLLFKKNRFKQL